MVIVPEKSSADDLSGRFREIICDPINLLIDRVPLAGVVKDGEVCLHNGIKVPCIGNSAYFGEFSQILVLNRGVHEPLEEFVFQELLKILPANAVILELGSYWAHYSMWLKQQCPDASAILVEAQELHIQVGVDNFARNGFAGEFIKAFVGPGEFEVDKFCSLRPELHINVLHVDIDLHEMGMVNGAKDQLSKQAFDYILISTHSQQLHKEVEYSLKTYGYRIEVSCDFDQETTSFDGFIFASAKRFRPVLPNFHFFGRNLINISSAFSLVESIYRTATNK